MIRLLARPRPLLPASFAFAVAFTVAMVTTVALATLLRGHDRDAALALLCAAAAYVGCWSRGMRATPAIGPLFWLCYNAFVENRYGELGWHGARDAAALALLTAAGLVPALVRAATIALSARRRFQRGGLQPFIPPPADRRHTSRWN